MNKWIGISLGTLFGVSHIGMIGYIATNNKNALPKLDIPVTPYTSYVVSANKRDTRSVILQMIPRQHTSLKILKKKQVS